MSSTPASHRLQRARRSAAFTLIELLTVIAIIGILAAILIPTVSMVREKAKTSQCTSRIRQWANVVNLYASDNKGTYHATQTDGFVPWCISSTTTNPNRYAKYFNQTTGGLDTWIYCPSRQDAESMPGTNTPDRAGYVLTWPSLNGVKVPDPTRIQMSRATSPSRTILFIDRFYSETSGTLTAGQTGTGATFSRDDASKLQVYRNFDRHNKSINVAFFDGSVRRMQWFSQTGNSLSTGVGVLAPFDVEWFRLDK